MLVFWMDREVMEFSVMNLDGTGITVRDVRLDVMYETLI